MMENAQVIKILTDLASIISEMFGSNCEVVISDLDKPDEAVIAIFNGYISNRKIGSPLIPHALKRIANAADGTYINYEKYNSKTKRRLKSSTYTIDLNGHNYSFCINYDCTDMMRIKTGLDEFMHMTAEGTDQDKDLINFSVDTPIYDALKEIINELGEPVEMMDKEDRLYIISELHKKGILKLQHSISTVAKYLGISRYTVYNYLNELGINMKSKSS